MKKHYKPWRLGNLLTAGYLFTRYSDYVCHDCMNRFPRGFRGRGRLVSLRHRGDHHVTGFGLRGLVPLVHPSLKQYLVSLDYLRSLVTDTAGTPIWNPTKEQREAAAAAGDIDYSSVYENAGYPHDDDQGRQGSCTAWDLIHHLIYWLIKKLGKFAGVILSAAYAYSWIRKRGGLSTTQDTGGNMIDVCYTEVERGCCWNPTMPYSDTNCSKKPSAAAETEAATNKLPAGTKIERVLPGDFKAALLATGGPINGGIPVDNAFENAVIGGWVTSPDVNKPASRIKRFIRWLLRPRGILGYHAVDIVGVVTLTAPDGSTGEFVKLKNSWGDTGDHSYWKLFKTWITSYINDIEAYKITVPTPTPTTQYTLTVQKTGQGTIKPYDAGSYKLDAGTQVILTPTAATGYAFSSWSGDVTSTNPSLTITMTKDMTVTATFISTTPTPAKATITLNLDKTVSGSWS